MGLSGKGAFRVLFASALRISGKLHYGLMQVVRIIDILGKGAF